MRLGAFVFSVLFAGGALADDAAQWLQRNAVPFATTEARSGLADLEPLRGIVGDARIVALGEATHGSREFFTMKHRILEFLVEEMGFTVFAIEANLPEADRVDDYVVTGKGSARAALRGLYFWTWNTEEVLDQIEWMREYNRRRGDRPPVRFRGFDMQFVPQAAALVERYVDRVDPARIAEIRSLYECISPSRSSRCQARVEEAHELIANHRQAWIAASSREEYERMLRYARVIVQAGSARTRRDEFMAENVQWLADTLHPGEKLVLWAHNGHVAASDSWMMGSWLRRRFGDAMVIFGFAFHHGGFNAIADHRLKANTIDASPVGQHEAFFAGAKQPLFLLDLRNPTGAEFLRPRRTMWRVGAVWNDAVRSRAGRWEVSLPAAFDVLVYIRRVQPSRLLRSSGTS